MIRILVDDRVLFDGELGDWVNRPPDEFRQMIKPGNAPKTWMKGILIAMGDAIQAPHMDTTITVQTGDGFWQMKVTTK
jgi:hypothetical protein